MQGLKHLNQAAQLQKHVPVDPVNQANAWAAHTVFQTARYVLHVQL